MHTDHKHSKSLCQYPEQKQGSKVTCPYRASDDKASKYDRCAHWFWQVEAAAHLWTPEIYESFSDNITITRLVDVAEINAAWKKEPKEYAKLHKYFHFDFVVTSRLRELGWRWRDCFSRSTKPTEIRAKNDYGWPLRTDRAEFCISACATEVHSFPGGVTRALQSEAEKVVSILTVSLQQQ